MLLCFILSDDGKSSKTIGDVSRDTPLSKNYMVQLFEWSLCKINKIRSRLTSKEAIWDHDIICLQTFTALSVPVSLVLIRFSHFIHRVFGYSINLARKEMFSESTQTSESYNHPFSSATLQSHMASISRQTLTHSHTCKHTQTHTHTHTHTHTSIKADQRQREF